MSLQAHQVFADVGRAGWSGVEELHFNDWARCGPGLEVGFTPDSREQLVQHAPALGRIGDETSAGREIDLRRFLEVKHELRISGEVCVPVSLARETTDVDSSAQIVKPDLDPARLSGSPTGRRDVDRAIADQCAARSLVDHPGFSGSSDKGIDRLAMVVDEVKRVAVGQARATELPWEPERHMTSVIERL